MVIAESLSTLDAAMLHELVAHGLQRPTGNCCADMSGHVAFLCPEDPCGIKFDTIDARSIRIAWHVLDDSS